LNDSSSALSVSHLQQEKGVHHMSNILGGRRVRFPAVIVAAVLGLAACGDDITNNNASVPTFTPNPIVTAADLQTALTTALASTNGGLDFPMWATVVDRAGVVVAVVHSGTGVGDQWLGSRAISAQKANTANDFSLDGFALSTANLYSATQPGGSLFGLQESNPVNTDVVYGGDFTQYGTTSDFMVGKKPGGVNVFGGGLALYDATGALIGAVGVSGDTSCADHNIAWRVRDALALDFVPAGVDAGTDDILYDITGGVSASGFGHPTCGGTEDTFDMPTLYPIS
jgi:uncharacterized protein GlcG (DUF336 family)